MAINRNDVLRRLPLEEKFQALQSFQEKPKVEIGKAWVQKRKYLHRERLREYWANVKAQRKEDNWDMVKRWPIRNEWTT